MKNEVLYIAGVLSGFLPRVDQLNLFIVYLNLFWGVVRFKREEYEKKCWFQLYR